ncbi:D-alanyl-D-alanine carboxypeptidase/D-alanyl-D-alanine endopeptidase [Oleiagrimonas citrea]
MIRTLAPITIQRLGRLLVCTPLLLAACSGQPPRPAPPAPSTPTTTAAPARAASIPASPRSAAAPAMPAPTSMPSARERMADAIGAYIAQPRFAHATWGIDVIDLSDGRTLYRRNADKLFIPASNAKLYTAALALHTLGPRYRFHTSLYASRAPSANGTLRGNLILYGRGDPSLGMGSDTQTPTDWADKLATVLAARGVKRITGDLIADDTYYAGPPFGAGWEASDLLSGFAAPVSALSVQGNTFTLRVGGNGACCTASVDPLAADVRILNTLHRSAPGEYDPLGLYRAPGSNRLYVFGARPPSSKPRVFNLATPDPARLAGGLLADALARHGIRFTGRIRTQHWPHPGEDEHGKGLVRITDVRSAPLGTLIRHMLKHSDNLYAQLLLMASGKHQSEIGTCLGQRHPPTLTAYWGICAMRAMLRDAGIAAGSAFFEEGSGLSRKDRVTPEATTRLLRWLDRQRFANDLKQALPVAGVDGTLRYRMRGTPAAGNLHAKTGTLRYAYTLSGYVRSANGQPLAFSIMLNDYARPRNTDGRPTAGRATRDIDAIARLITEYGNVPLPSPSASGSAVPAGKDSKSP